MHALMGHLGCTQIGRRVQLYASSRQAAVSSRPHSICYSSYSFRHAAKSSIITSSSIHNSSLTRRQLLQHIRCAASSNESSSSSSSSAGAAAAAAAAVEADAVPVEPFTEDDLRDLTEYEQSWDDEDLGEVWRSEFQDDIDGLYDYVDRDQMDFADRIAELKGTPKHLWEQVGLLEKLERYPPGLVADMMGMGTWRLNGAVDEVFSFLVGRIESSMRELLETDLALYPTSKWKDKGWDFIDSLDLKKEWDGFSYVDMPDPLKGMEGYPRLLIENRVYSSRVFRKLHLEVAHRQDGLQVLHMVFFPRYDFDIPILALDLVAAGGAITLAIIDACPVTSRLTLPQHYIQTMLELQHNFLPESCQGRNIPEWGSKIFSPLCLCIRPDQPEELGGFMKYAVALTRAHLMYSQLLNPLSPTDKASARRLSELLACHERFCQQQLANTKTARVLEVAFDTEFTEQYMKQFMFDYSPKEDVPWFDGSLAKLYEYFENNPEVWTDAEEFMKTRMKLDEKKASDYLNRFLAGDPSIKLPRLSFALQHMYEYDADFKAAVDASLADKHPDEVPDEVDMGQYLAEQLTQLVYGQSAAERMQEVEAAASEQRRQQLQETATAEPVTKTSDDKGDKGNDKQQDKKPFWQSLNLKKGNEGKQ